MSTATAMTTPVANRFFSRLATTCPVMTADALIGIARNRSTNPEVMSFATDSEVEAAPKPAQVSTIPGTT